MKYAAPSVVGAMSPVPGGALAGTVASTALMGQEMYYRKLHELKKATQEGKIDLSDEQMREEAHKSAIAETAPEIAGNVAEIGIYKAASSLVSKFVPGAGPVAQLVSSVRKAVKGSTTGDELFDEVFKKHWCKRLAQVLLPP